MHFERSISFDVKFVRQTKKNVFNILRTRYFIFTIEYHIFSRNIVLPQADPTVFYSIYNKEPHHSSTTPNAASLHFLRYSQSIPRSLASDSIHKVGCCSGFWAGVIIIRCPGVATVRNGGGFGDPHTPLGLVLLHVILLKHDSRGSAPQHINGVKRTQKLQRKVNNL